MKPTTWAARGARANWPLQPTALTTGLALCLATALPAPSAMAQNFTLQVEPAVAFWLDKPQSERFGTGFYGAVRPGISVADGIVGLQWSYAALLVPKNNDFDQPGSGHFLSAGVRLRPLATLGDEDEQLGGLWVDVNLGYVRTGDLDRFGPDAGIGYGFQVADTLALGPVIRYGQILQNNHVLNVDPSDAQFLTAGLNFSLGPKVKAAETCPDAPVCAEPEPPPPCPTCAEVVPVVPLGCADSDKDGVCDADDRCPTEAGPPETLGCPVDPCTGKPLVVLVQFSEDSSGMPRPSRDSKMMDPVLDQLALAMTKDTACRVCIIGHASEDGAPDHNQKLSESRAAAVRTYLVARGLTDLRMPVVGQGEMCPLVPEAGRELNRRVEFMRLDEGQSCPSKTACTQ